MCCVVPVCVRVCVFVPACVFMCAYLCVCVCLCVCVRSCVCVHACVRRVSVADLDQEAHRRYGKSQCPVVTWSAQNRE
jgi:hypothetical protein